MKLSIRFMYVGLFIFCCCYWAFDSIWSYLSFERNLQVLIFNEPMSYLDTFLLKVPPYQAVSRITVIVLFLSCGLLVLNYMGKKLKAEETLQIGKERYNLATQAAKVGVWDWDIKANEFYLDPVIKALLGYSDEEIPNDVSKWSAYIHPDDTEAVMGAAQDHLDGKTPEYLCEHRMMHKNGSIRWIIVQGKAIHDADGTAIRMVGTDADITERKQAEEELTKYRDHLEELVKKRTTELEQEIAERKLMEEKYKILMESVDAGLVLIDLEGNFLLINDHAASPIALKPEEITGKNIRDIFSPGEFFEDYFKALEQIKKTGEGFEQERYVEFLAKWFLESIQPVKCDTGEIIAIQVLTYDITERMNAEEETQKLISLIENSQDFIGLSTLDGQVTYVNKTGLRLIGLNSLDEAKKTFIFDYVPEHLRAAISEEALPMIMSNQYWRSYTNFINFKNGDTFPIEINLFPIIRPNSEDPVAIALVGKDLKEQQKLENQLRQVQKMESLGTLAGGIAHDFNTLIGTIIGYSAIISKEIPEESDIQDYLSSITKVANRAKTLVKQIGDFSRPTTTDKAPLDIISFTRGSMGFVKTILPATIHIQEKYEFDKLIINANEDQINQVLVNLCSNASDFMTDNKGILKIAIEKIDKIKESTNFQETLPGHYIKLSVSDTGCGIDPDEINRVFDPYYSTKEIGKGSGLGLSIVYSIIHNHNGHISVDSKLGEGTTFFIFLPLLEENHVQST